MVTILNIFQQRLCQNSHSTKIQKKVYKKKRKLSFFNVSKLTSALNVSAESYLSSLRTGSTTRPLASSSPSASPSTRSSCSSSTREKPRLSSGSLKAERSWKGEGYCRCQCQCGCCNYFLVFLSDTHCIEKPENIPIQQKWLTQFLCKQHFFAQRYYRKKDIFSPNNSSFPEQPNYHPTVVLYSPDPLQGVGCPSSLGIPMQKQPTQPREESPPPPSSISSE